MTPTNDNYGNYGKQLLISEGVITWAYYGHVANGCPIRPAMSGWRPLPMARATHSWSANAIVKLGIGALWSTARGTGGTLGGSARERPNLRIWVRAGACCANDNVGSIAVLPAGRVFPACTRAG